MRIAIAVLVVALITSTVAPAGAETWLIPPVDGPVAKGFDLPEGHYGPGNRGLEYGVAPGAGVRAAGDGTITFAGEVAGRLAVTIEHSPGFESTYTSLRDLYVSAGSAVGQGEWLGEADERFHFGVKIDDVYVDPVDYLGPLDAGDAIHLVPTEGDSIAARDFGVPDGRPRRCTPRDEVQELTAGTAPNDNVAVVIGGINSEYSSTRGPKSFAVPGALRYPPGRVVRFSYSGDPDGYGRADTQGDIRRSALRLEELLRDVRRRYPWADVDLIAHSQGGLVARSYLTSRRSAWDPSLPRVEHLVTFATPHRGAALAGEIEDLDRYTASGGSWLDAVSEGKPSWLFDGALGTTNPGLQKALRDGVKVAHDVLGDPRGESIAQMAPGSEFLSDLSAEDLVFGTRVMALQDRWDAVVPSHRARFGGEINRAVDDGWLWARHEEILDSQEALAMARTFLRDAPAPCLTEGDYDRWASGHTVEGAEDRLDRALALAEEAVVARILGVAGGTGKAARGFRSLRESGRALVKGGFGGLRRRAERSVRSAARKVRHTLTDPEARVGWTLERLRAELIGRVTDAVLDAAGRETRK